MMRIGMSPAASGLLRALLDRAAIDRDRILLTEFRSTDWQSLTFIGERHEFELRISGADTGAILARLLGELDDCEFTVPGHLVADIGTRWEPVREPDGSVRVALEALTLVAN